MKTTNRNLGFSLVCVGLPAYTVLASLRVEMILAGVPAATIIVGLGLCLLPDY